MSRCKYVPIEDSEVAAPTYKCEKCRHQITCDLPPEKIYRRCDRTGLGDLLARVLAWLGIRKSPGCGCAARQQALNKLTVPTRFKKREKDDQIRA